MKRLVLSVCLVLTAVFALAAPKAKPGKAGPPTAPGFAVWHGVTDDNCIRGRKLIPEDLRQRLVVVVETDFEHIKDAIPLAPILRYNVGLPQSEGWEFADWNRKSLALISIRGKCDPKTVEEMLKKNEKFAQQLYHSANFPIYRDLYLESATDATGKYPHLYVLGPEGEKPLLDVTEAKADSLKQLDKIAKDVDAKIKTWKSFYGYVGEPKHFPDLKKALDAGKPLVQALQKIDKGILSKDEAVATEAQNLHDALYQWRSDLGERIRRECAGNKCPHRASIDLKELTSKFPNEKKNFSCVDEALKKSKDFAILASALERYLQIQEEDFKFKNAGEQKKYLAEFEKYQKEMKRITESTFLPAQTAAYKMAEKVETAIGLIPSLPIGGK